MPLIDETTAFGQRVRRQLEREVVIWLITQGKGGTPQPSPVWFLLDEDDSLLMYSRRNTPKLRNITAHPTVALAFNTDPAGDAVTIFHGDARIDDAAPAAVDLPAYVEKYGHGIEQLGMTPQSFSDQYEVPVRITLTNLRGF